MSNIHFILQGKGGVGKTMVSSILMQFLSDIDESLLGIDTDSVNHTLAQYKAYNVKDYDIYRPESSYLDESVIEQMAEYIYESPHNNIIIDNGASSFVPLLQYLTSNNIIPLLQEAGHEVYIHTVITGGQGLEDTVGGLVSILGSFTDVSVITWLNYKFGDIEKNGKPFKEWPAYKNNKERISGIIPVDFQQGQLFQEDLEFMLSGKLTFDEAMAQSKLFSRNRLKQMKKQIFDLIEATDLPCFADTTKES